MIPKTHTRTCLRAGAMLLALLAAAAARADYASTVLGKGPLAYWRFNETATSPPLNAVTNSTALGTILDGYASADAATSVGKGETGIVGSCLRFNNPGNTVGHCGTKVDVAWNATLNPLPPFSIEFWAKPNSIGADSTGFCPISNFNPNWFNGGNRSGWLFYVNNSGRWQFRLGATSGYAGICSGTSHNATAGTWQHIVATYDGTNANLYADGVLIGTAAAPLSAWTANPISFLRMGGTPLTGDDAPADNAGNALPVGTATSTCGNRGWDGWLDEVALYSKLLTPDLVAAHHDAASTNTVGYSAQILADGPAAYWGMEDAAVPTPDPSTFPAGANLGSLGGTADGTNQWGVLAGQSGSGASGLGADNHAGFFDGANGFFQANDAPGLHFTGNITMMAWIKPLATDFYRDILAHGFDDNGAETFLRISRGYDSSGAGVDNATFYEAGVTDGQNYYDAARIPMPPGDVGNWVHVTGTYDGANWNIYRNGVLAASVASSNPAFNVTNRWAVGSRSDPKPGTGLFFAGSIDEPAIFSTALSASDINSIYNAAQAPPVITQAPQNPGTVFSGYSATLSVWAEGTPPLSFLWTSNGVPTGVTTTNYTANSLAAGNVTIAVIVTNSFGSVTSAVDFVVVNAPPSISQQPQPVTRFSGAKATFSVSAGGSLPLSYQWKLGGTAVSGATASSYTVTASSATAGDYTVTLNNSGGNLDSAAATLTVLPVPSGYPAAVLTDTPVSYWRLDEASGTLAHDYVGGNDGTYFNATLGQPGYSVLDSDTAVSFNGVNSYVGNISGTAINFTGHTNFSLEAWVNAPPGQPDQSTIIAKGIGNTGTTRTEQFALDVSGGTYRFFIAGNNDVIYEVSASSGPNGNWQHVVGVYDDNGSQMYIYVNGVQEAQSGTRPAGLNATVSPVSIGSKRTGNDPGYDGTFNGSVDDVAVYSTALTLPQVQAHFAAAYGSTLPPAISVEPQPATNYVSLPIKFSVSAYGSFPLAYQWRKDAVDIAGATDATYVNNAVALTDAGNYSVHVSNAVGSTNSAAAALVVLAAPASPPNVPDLVLHLPFDGNLTDATGRGNNGTSVGGTTFVNDGALGKALHYSTDPTTGTNYVTLGVLSDLKFSSNVNFTVSYWARLPLNYTGDDLPFFCNAVGSTFGQGFVFAPSSGSPSTVNPNGWPGAWATSLFDTGGTGFGVFGVQGSLNDGFWHHLVHVFTRGVSSVTYLDGIVAAYTVQSGITSSTGGDVSNNNPANIGQDPTGTYNVDGSADIDDLGVWRRALQPLEAASIYIAGVSNKLSFTGSAPAPTPATLTAVQAGSNLIISWTPAGGTLQSTTALLPTGTTWTTVGTTNPATVAIGSGDLYFRVANQ